MSIGFDSAGISFDSSELLDENSPFWEEFHRREAEQFGKMASALVRLTRSAEKAGEYARRGATAGAKALACREARGEEGDADIR